MKRLIPILSIIALLFAACKKGNFTKDDGLIIEPFPPKLISSDTIRTGGLWGLTIGQRSDDVYAKIQLMQAEKKIAYLAVVANVFNSLDSLANRIPLYTNIYLDETLGTSTGIQIAFTDNKVSSIFNNNGNRFGRWPVNESSSIAIVEGDKREDIYAKLVAIKQVQAYAPKFERISIFSKDISKAYDQSMGLSPQWYLTTAISEKRYNFVQLYFTAGKISSITSTVYESQ